jgi:hypothetical protein
MESHFLLADEERLQTKFQTQSSADTRAISNLRRTSGHCLNCSLLCSNIHDNTHCTFCRRPAIYTGSLILLSDLGFREVKLSTFEE